MTIATMAVDDPLTAAKMNEIIDALNAFALSWVNFNGDTTITIRDSIGNIGGVTRTGPGTYRITFSTAMANANYCVIANCSNNLGNDTGFVVLVALTTTYVDIQCHNDDGGYNDCTIVTLTIFGG